MACSSSGGATANTIGGTVAGAGNVISGNGQIGVTLVDSGTSNNIVAGNLIGTDASGTGRHSQRVRACGAR